MTLSQEQYKILTEWIAGNLIRTKTYNKSYDTGTIRTCFEQSDVGFYLDNETFNQVMVDCGYTPKYPGHDQYWCFTVSRKSPAFIQYFGRNR